MVNFLYELLKCLATGVIGGVIGGSIVVFIIYSIDFISGNWWWSEKYGFKGNGWLLWLDKYL